MENEAYRVPINQETTASGVVKPPSGGGGSGEMSHSNNVNGSVPAKRKRGRPKKIPETAQPVMETSSPLLGFPSPNSTQPPPKRGRGRPRGSGNPRLARSSPPPGSSEEIYKGYSAYEVNMAPHVLAIYPGEDVHERILSFAQSGSLVIIVLSCNGPVSRISINSHGSTGGMIYEGLFEILKLTGTFTCVRNEGSYHRRGTLTASLAKSNGEVFGGRVSGPIIAAGPIQLILCSFPQLKRASETQLRHHPVPNSLEATPPLASALPQDTVAIAKANDQRQEAVQDQDNINPSLKLDSVAINTQAAPVVTNTEADLASAPALVRAPSPRPPSAD